MVFFHDSLREHLIGIDEVQQYPDNYNNGDVEAIAASMEVNGVFQAVIAQRSTGYILAGNHRYAALKYLGSQVIPVLWIDCDDERARRILVADNLIGKAATPDEALLADHLALLDATEVGLLGTGMTPGGLQAMLERLAEPLDLGDMEQETYAKQRSHFECPNCGWSPL